MDLNRAYPVSPFTDYYGTANPYYTMPYPANYSRPAYAVNTGYDVHSNGAGVTTCSPAFTQQAVVAKPYGAEALQPAAPPPWPTFPAAWDPAKMDGLSLCIPDGAAQDLLSGGQQKRKRKTTPSQRLAANIRERRRMCNLNTAFDRLRRRVPAFPHEKRLSRIQTLRLSIMYISFMTELLSGQDIRTIMKSRNIDPTKPIVWQPYGDDGGGSFVS